MTAKLSVVRQKEPVDLERLGRMRPAELQRLYLEIFGATVPSGNPALARRRIAWQVQAQREGGLPESARQHALALARESGLRVRVAQCESQAPVPHATVTSIISTHDSRLPMPGSLIVKHYQGKTVTVRVLDSGFDYDGRHFTSLSAIAKDITGTKWNGYSFFGLTKERHGR